ncbi:MAG: alpha/beta hydrolase [Pirellulaceae bacterium]
MPNTAPPAAEGITVVLEPHTQAFLDKLAADGGPQIYELSVDDARGVLSGAQADPVEKISVDSEERVISVGPRGSIPIRIVRPKDSTGVLPAVMYFHGGGWVLGDAETHDRLIREIAHGAQAAVVFVEYCRAPEARYPVPIEEAYAATKWVSEQGKTINVDGSRLALAGDSVGGNMAAAVTLLARERGGPRLLFQVLFYPVTNAAFDTPSYEQFAQGYFLTREAMKWFWDHYAPEVASRTQPTASPLRATTDQLQGLPPALVISGECDVLRDEGEAYARKLIQAGVDVTALRYLGTIHDFVMLNAITDTPAARSAIAHASEMLHKALAQ